MGFRNPTKEERSGDERLVNQRIAIYWDGDNVYYPGRVVSYNAEAATAQVLYENDESGEQYEESLAEVRWLLWDESAENHPDCDKSEVENWIISKALDVVAYYQIYTQKPLTHSH